MILSPPVSLHDDAEMGNHDIFIWLYKTESAVRVVIVKGTVSAITS